MYTPKKKLDVGHKGTSSSFSVLGAGIGLKIFNEKDSVVQEYEILDKDKEKVEIDQVNN
jgi:hypothetical protein